jgi:hypothetical protein
MCLSCYFLRKLEAGFQMTKVLEPGILKTKNFERMANDLERHLQVRNIKHQKSRLSPLYPNNPPLMTFISSNLLK